MNMRFGRVVGLLAVLALVLAACGDDSGADETTTTESSDTTEAPDMTEPMDDMSSALTGEASDLGIPIVDPLEVEGDVLIAGSSTVFPLSVAVVEQWADEGGPSYSIDSIGSGGGFERFCVEGASDISNASRPIKEEEVASCVDTWGDEPIEIRVGTDALSVVISQGNYFAQEMTIEEIGTAFTLPEGSTWADVNPDFPPHPIQAFSPGADSGTFDYFNEVIYEEADPPPILEAGTAEIVGEDDNVTVTGVAEDGCTEGDTSSTCAIGYFGYAFFINNTDVLQAVAVDGVAPSEDAVNNDEYPLARPLFMYTAPAVVEANPQVAYFIAYYLNNVNDVIGEVGYFPAPDERLMAAGENIVAAAGWDVE